MASNKSNGDEKTKSTDNVGVEDPGKSPESKTLTCDGPSVSNEPQLLMNNSPANVKSDFDPPPAPEDVPKNIVLIDLTKTPESKEDFVVIDLTKSPESKVQVIDLTKSPELNTSGSADLGEEFNPDDIMMPITFDNDEPNVDLSSDNQGLYDDLFNELLDNYYESWGSTPKKEPLPADDSTGSETRKNPTPSSNPVDNSPPKSP